jgi:PAS domain S-box-containing protein
MTAWRGASDGAATLSDSVRRRLMDAPDGLFVTTDGNSIVLWNDAAERVMGYRSGEVVGRSCRAVLSGCTPGGSPRCMTGCDIASVLSVNGVDQSFEMQARTKHGEMR